jgi:hypothetical protein
LGARPRLITTAFGEAIVSFGSGACDQRCGVRNGLRGAAAISGAATCLFVI